MCFLCFVLEDVVRPVGVKVPGRTAIPAGTYPISFEKSPRLSALKGRDLFTPRLHNVPGFEGVLIHVGNYDQDTDGCLLPGLTRAANFVGSSGPACDKLYPLIQHACAHEGCQIEITHS